jgi:hypothetical protein
MNKVIIFLLAVSLSVASTPAFPQTKNPADTTATLGLAGDNLDLYAVLDLFQKSKTIEAFEKSLNDEKTHLNNLDLNLDKKVDFIKVVTTKKDSSYTFVLRVDISKDESQDVAVILLDKLKGGKISLQIVGDEELYGKDYVIEPKGNSSITANPAYTGDNPVTVNVPASTTVVVQSAPIVQYVYSPAYVPYAPPYYYGFYPPWFGFATVMAVGIYRSNHYYHGHGYHGGYYHGGNTVIVNNRNSINHYNNSRNTSNTVRNNQAKGNYGNGSIDRSGGRASASTRPSNSPSNRAGNGASVSDRQSPSAGNRQSPSAGNRASTSDRSFNSPSASNRSSSSFGSSGRGGSSSWGGGRSMGSGRSGGGGGRRR